MVTDRTLPDNIYGGGLQARLSLARPICAPRATKHIIRWRTGLSEPIYEPNGIQHGHATRSGGGSRHLAMSSAEAGRRLMLKACPAHKPRGETGAAQEEGEGTGFADALARMLGRGRART